MVKVEEDTVVVKMLQVVSLLEQRTLAEVEVVVLYKVALVVKALLRLDISIKTNF